MKNKGHLFGLLALLLTSNLFAWGAEGHRIIGMAAFEMLDETARTEVLGILDQPAPAELANTLSEACSWPDTVREQNEWAWSSPLHYVNIPRNTDRYDRERDCPEGRCATEGIIHFAGQLAYPDMASEKRWQAFAFVCHLVADLHQPLHAGFRDDRGANTVDVVYRGEEYNLHWFWDGVNVRARLGDEDQMVARLARAGITKAGGDWSPSEVAAWTEQSHALAKDKAYPEGRVIDEGFADSRWALSVLQWERAAERLARLLNAVLGDSEVLVSD